MASLLRTNVEDVLANLVTLGIDEIEVKKGVKLPIDPKKDVEYHTDKEAVKIVPCRNADCKRPMVVTTFFAAAKAECRVCTGETDGERRKAAPGSLQAVVPGETDPALAVNLQDALINKQFMTAVCPMCQGEMELKSVNHSDTVGPGHWVHGKEPRWEQTAKGETVMFQCNDDLTVVTMATTARHRFRRANEVRPGKDANVWGDEQVGVGIREEHPKVTPPPAPEPAEEVAA
jgi:hypothetical protein